MVYRVYNHKMSFVEELVHMDSDESSPQTTGKGIYSDVSDVIMVNMIDENIPKEDQTPTKTKQDIMEDKYGSTQEQDK